MTIFVKGDKVVVTQGLRKGTTGTVVRQVIRNGKHAEVVIESASGYNIAPKTEFVAPDLAGAAGAAKHDFKEGQAVLVNTRNEKIVDSSYSTLHNFQHAVTMAGYITLIYRDELRPELGDLANVVFKGEFMVIPVTELQHYSGRVARV